MSPGPDENERMLRDSLLLTALFWASVLALVFLSVGCTQHKVDVSSSSVDRLLDKMADMKPPVQCRKLDLQPVPEDVLLDIKADNITANAGGETVLRGYVACRSLYRDASASTTPTATP